jgi:5-methylthioadenosine/S-adenosylhomocysteine deaminase
MSLVFSKDYLKYIVDVAKKNNLPIQVHLAENQLQQDNIIRQFNKREVEYLDEIGLFDVNVFAAHCVVLEDDEYNILNSKNIHMVHCPKSNLKLGSGIANLKKWNFDNTLIGTDSVASNNKIDIVEEARFASLLQKGIHNDPTFVKPYEAFKMITYNAYNSIGLKGGKIEKDFLADLVIFKDLPSINFDPVEELVFSDLQRPLYTIIDGKIVYNGKVKNEDLIKEEYKKEFKQLYGEV